MPDVLRTLARSTTATLAPFSELLVTATLLQHTSSFAFGLPSTSCDERQLRFPSTCQQAETALRSGDWDELFLLLPLMSWLVLRGRCAKGFQAQPEERNVARHRHGMGPEF